MPSVRTSAAITLSAWKALFLRAAVNSLSTGRAAWFWLLAEPIAHIVLLMWVFSVFRVRTIGGISTAVWIMAGLLAFFMFRRTAAESITSVGAGRALFNYPQIKPVDTVPNLMSGRGAGWDWRNGVEVALGFLSNDFQ